MGITTKANALRGNWGIQTRLRGNALDPVKGLAVIRNSWSDKKIKQMTADCAISSNLCLILTNIEKSEVRLRTRTVSRIPDDPKERNTSN